MYLNVTSIGPSTLQILAASPFSPITHIQHWGATLDLEDECVIITPNVYAKDDWENAPKLVTCRAISETIKYITDIVILNYP